MLHNDPQVARQMQLEQLLPIITLSLQAPNLLLDMHTLTEVQKIYEQRAGGDNDGKPIPKIKGKISIPKPAQAVVPGAPKIVLSIKKPAIPITVKVKMPEAEAAPPALVGLPLPGVPKKIIIKAPIKIPPRMSDAAPASESIDAPAVVPPKVPSKAPVIKAIIKVPVPLPKAAASDISVVEELNQDHRKADKMTQEQLEGILREADQKYYVGTDDRANDVMLEDKVYDYIKRIYNQRRLGTNDKEQTMRSVSSKTGVGTDAKPVRGRDSVLPVVLLSLDNLYMGEGDVATWSGKKKGPYVVSAKMDGNSALYHNNILYTRGNATSGRNISHILQYLNLPEFPHAVRGEIVMDKNLFNTKYKGKAGSSTGARKTVRNSVSGAIGAINHMDKDLLGDLQFVAYEIITEEKTQLKPSAQYQMLEEAGFTVAHHVMMQHITDEILSQHHHQLLETYPYEIDGLVLLSDYPYSRATDKNPDYAKAFKDALDTDIAVTTVTNIEWNVSQYGYLIPTVVYKTVQIAGVELSRATAHNAKELIKLGLGPGAEIEVIYWAKVNPRVHQVLKPVEPSMPTVAWKWVPNGGEPVHIMFDEEAQEDEESVSEMRRDIDVKKIHKFLTTIDAKGIGEITVGKIYDTGKRTVGDFINMTVEEISFLGDKTSRNIIDAISNAMNRITVPVLMASSKVFGRGIGVRKLTKVFRDNPQFISERLTHAEYVAAFQKVDGFALKTATLTADGMEAFWEFIDTEIPSEVYEQVISNTITEFETTEASSLDERHPDINGKKICLTGFRSPEVQGFIEKNGGQVQSDCNGNTNMVVRVNDGYDNNKTGKATAKGIPLISLATFKQTYMSE